MTYRNRKFAFTLVELLVVIGIIAVLIGILLPALSKAREQANTTKCMSALRSIGQAFQLYANEHKDAWPVVRQDVPEVNGQPQNGLPTSKNIYWNDVVGPYVTKGKQNFQVTNQLEADAARLSVMWGCPNWQTWRGTGSSFYNGESIVDTGYSMNYLPTADHDNPRNGFALPPLAERAMRVDPAVGAFGVGKYYKRTQYTKPAERILVTETTLWYLGINGNATSNVIKTVPSQSATRTTVSDSGNSMIDRFRHGKYPPVINSQFKHDPGKSRIRFNALYCDGSVRTLSDYWEAYKGITMKLPPKI